MMGAWTSSKQYCTLSRRWSERKRDKRSLLDCIHTNDSTADDDNVTLCHLLHRSVRDTYDKKKSQPGEQFDERT